MPIVLQIIVFTDLVDSTRIKKEMPGETQEQRDQAYVDRILRPHQVKILADLAHYDGTVINRLGDGYFLTFPTPDRAAQWAIGLQLAHITDPIESPLGTLEVRIGIHTGSPVPVESDWVGAAVDHASRITTLAAGGQILLSEATAALVRDAQINDLQVFEHGPYFLKGIGYAIVSELLYASQRPRPPQPARSSDLTWQPLIVFVVVLCLLASPLFLQPRQQEASIVLVESFKTTESDAQIKSLSERMGSEVRYQLIELDSGKTLDVISNKAVERFEDLSIEQLGNELGAHWLVIGSVSKNSGKEPGKDTVKMWIEIETTIKRLPESKVIANWIESLSPEQLQQPSCVSSVARKIAPRIQSELRPGYRFRVTPPPGSSSQ